MFKLQGIKNPVSLRPTSKFDSIIIVDSNTQKDISDFEGELFIQNEMISNIPRELAEIKQSSYEKLAENEIALEFYTNNPLPKTAAILV